MGDKVVVSISGNNLVIYLELVYKLKDWFIFLKVVMIVIILVCWVVFCVFFLIIGFFFCIYVIEWLFVDSFVKIIIFFFSGVVEVMWGKIMVVCRVNVSKGFFGRWKWIFFKNFNKEIG